MQWVSEFWIPFRANLWGHFAELSFSEIVIKIKKCCPGISEIRFCLHPGPYRLKNMNCIARQYDWTRTFLSLSHYPHLNYLKTPTHDPPLFHSYDWSDSQAYARVATSFSPGKRSSFESCPIGKELCRPLKILFGQECKRWYCSVPRLVGT